MVDVAANVHAKQVARRTAAVIFGALAALNTMFWFLSTLYFDDHHLDAANIMVVRGAFVTLTGVLSIATFIASLAPRTVGHVLATLLGCLALVSSVEAMRHGMPAAMCGTLLIAGILFPVLAWWSWRGSRPAWSFLIAMACVFGITSFFGAPKLRSQLDTSLWYALIVPGLYFTTVASLTMLRGHYRR